MCAHLVKHKALSSIPITRERKKNKYNKVLAIKEVRV